LLEGRIRQPCPLARKVAAPWLGVVLALVSAALEAQESSTCRCARWHPDAGRHRCNKITIAPIPHELAPTFCAQVLALEHLGEAALWAHARCWLVASEGFASAMCARPKMAPSAPILSHFPLLARTGALQMELPAAYASETTDEMIKERMDALFAAANGARSSGLASPAPFITFETLQRARGLIRERVITARAGLTAASDYSRLGPQPSRTSPQTHASGRLHLGRGSGRFRPHDGPQPPCVTVSDRIMQQPVGLLWDYCATWDRDTRRAASECHFRSPLLWTLRRTFTAPQASRGGGAI
jgi:hypothetical protein